MIVHQSIACPCCQRPVAAPTLEIIIDHYTVPDLEAAILRVVWRGRGHPVPTERIFDAMYADDPDGGPTQTQMYRAFKAALFRLRRRLDGFDPNTFSDVRIREGSGVSIENVGYRRGYRLTMKGE